MTGPTAKVRIGLDVSEALAPHCPGGSTAKTLAPHMEPWIAERYAAAVNALVRLQPGPPRSEPRRRRDVATIRLPAWHVRRLGIIAEVENRWVGELVEEWLVGWLSRQSQPLQAGQEQVMVAVGR